MSGRTNAPVVPPHAEPSEAIGIVFVCFGWFIGLSLMAIANWRPDYVRWGTDMEFYGMMASELVLGAMAIVLLWGRHYPLHMLYPRPSWRGMLDAALLAAGAFALYKLFKVLMPAYAILPTAETRDATRTSWSSTVAYMIVNGSYQEIFLLAYLMRGLRRYGTSTALGIMLLVRMLYHAFLGPAGVVPVMADGLLFGLYFQRKGQLFPVVLAHIAVDLLACF